MQKIIFIILFSSSILWTSCNGQDKDLSSFTDTDIQTLKADIEKDELWKEYVSIMHKMTNIVASKKLYVEETLYKNPPNIASKLAKVQSDDEAHKVLLSLGYTEIHADLNIKWLNCVKNLQKKFPQMTQLGPQKLNLQVPPPDEYPFNATKDRKDFLDKRNKRKQ